MIRLFGVISLLGAEQADYIRELLVQKIDKYDDLKKTGVFLRHRSKISGGMSVM